jgi:hypothetical protein
MLNNINLILTHKIFKDKPQETQLVYGWSMLVRLIVESRACLRIWQMDSGFFGRNDFLNQIDEEYKMFKV